MKEKTQKLVEYIMAKNYGDIVCHKEIAELIGEQYSTTKYTSIVNAAKKVLLDSGHMVENVRKIGYRVVDPDNYTTHSVRQVISGARKIDNGTRIIQHAPVSDMSPEGVEAYRRVDDRLQILHAAITGAKVEISMLGTKRQHPLRQLGQGEPAREDNQS